MTDTPRSLAVDAARLLRASSERARVSPEVLRVVASSAAVLLRVAADDLPERPGSPRRSGGQAAVSPPAQRSWWRRLFG